MDVRHEGELEDEENCIKRILIILILLEWSNQECRDRQGKWDASKRLEMGVECTSETF